MKESPQKPEESQSFEDMMFGMTKFMQTIQQEVAIVLIQNKQIRKLSEKILNKPDHEIVNWLNNEVKRFMVAITIAESYGVNMPMNMIATHSSITGNNALADAMEAVQKKIQQINN